MIRSAARAVLKPAQRRCRGQSGVALAGRLHQRIVPERRVVVQVLVALNQPEHALPEHVPERVFDPLRIARIGKRARHRLEQTQATLQLPEQRQSAVAGDRATVEIHFNTTPPERLEINLLRSTIWHRRTPR